MCTQDDLSWRKINEQVLKDIETSKVEQLGSCPVLGTV